MPMVQMNTRIDQDLKQRGDAVLARAGLSPSEAVRSLWEFAAAHEHEPKAVAKILSIKDLYEQDEQRKQAERKIESLNRIQQILAEFYQQYGITEETRKAVESLSDEELYEMELLERYEERGLL